MPELPEVETVRRVLQECITGKTITEVRIGRPTFYRRPPAHAVESLPGTTVSAVRRRGKYLLLTLSGGKEFSMHLGMSGRVILGPGQNEHTRFQLIFGNQTLTVSDARRFGRVGCALPPLGPEPLESEFNEQYLWKALRGRRAKIKALLMDQRVVAGLGNIYATEALFNAGVRPGRAAGKLSRGAIARLCRAIKEVLTQAIKLRGSTLDDASFLDPLGHAGQAQEAVSVYGREIGLCGHALKSTRARISGRTSLYCPVCQR